MKFRKLVMQCGVIAAVIAFSVPAAVSVSAAEPASETQTIEGQIEDANSANADKLQETTKISKTEDKTNARTEAKEADSEWADKLLVVVDEETSLNIRKEADTESEIMGKIYRACKAEVLEKGEEWSRIKSGGVEGYVKNEYCVFGSEAEEKAEELCDKKAVANDSGIRIRSEASTDAKILAVIDEGEKLDVAHSEEETDGWVLVEYDDEVAYISADFVDVELEIAEAESMETIRAREEAKRAAEEAARKEAEAKAAAEREAAAAREKASKAESSDEKSGSSSQSSQESSQESQSESSSESVSASSDDLTLLAAIIECEAGGEPYAGQLAVGAVVMNRVRSGSFPNSISGVIYQRGQFSPASSGKLARVLSRGSISSSCYSAAKEALAGADNTGGCLYFHSGTSGNGTVIGSQIFY